MLFTVMTMKKQMRVFLISMVLCLASLLAAGAPLKIPVTMSYFSVLQKTVVAVLDRLVNPHWPYLPEKSKELGENSDRIERAWSSVPDDPMNYDFFYHVLEADDQGRVPKMDEKTLNEFFNTKSVSSLRCIAESDDKVWCDI